jgi:hypothetical protein
MTTAKPKLWMPGDWNAFFGFGTNILVNLLTLTALLRFALKMPDELVFGRILPATGMMLFLSTIYYAWLAYSAVHRPADRRAIVPRDPEEPRPGDCALAHAAFGRLGEATDR